MIVGYIASQSIVAFGIQHNWRDPVSGVHVSPDSAEILVKRGEITNYRSLLYSLSIVSAKNYENLLMCIEVMACYISVVFWDTVYFRPRKERSHHASHRISSHLSWFTELNWTGFAQTHDRVTHTAEGADPVRFSSVEMWWDAMR